MRRRRVSSGNTDIFGLAFLDVISCAFGAVLAMVLLSKESVVDVLTKAVEEVTITAPTPEREDLGTLEAELHALLLQREELSRRIKEEKIKTASAKVRVIEKEIEQRSMQRNVGSIESIYAGGVPVGRENIVFIVDTSGSMQNQWPLVTKTISDIINMHPQVSGLQILSDNGHYLIPGYKGRWIPDSQSVRDRVLKMLESWQTFSSSSPAEGLEVALKTYAKPGSDLSVYVLGDDFTGSSYEYVVGVVDRWNVDRVTGKRIAAIHAIGIPIGLGDRFGTLMRHITYQNKGVFIGL